MHSNPNQVGTVSDRRLIEHAESLRCVECAATTTDGIGLRAYLTVGDEDAEHEEAVAILCPECVNREFNGP